MDWLTTIHLPQLHAIVTLGAFIVYQDTTEAVNNEIIGKIANYRRNRNQNHYDIKVNIYPRITQKI